MKHEVFVLNYARGWNQTNSEIEIISNLQELNDLLNQGWLIDNTISLGSHGNIQSIVYNLKMSKGTKSHSA